MRYLLRIRTPEITGLLLLVMLLCQPVSLFACEDDKTAVADAPAQSSKAASAGDSAKINAKRTHATKKVSEKPSKNEQTQASDAPNFDMDVLIARVKKTDAIGVFSKLALRSDALDLMGMVKAWRRHVKKLSLDEVRSQYDGLLLKILALLGDDPVLSRDISLAREQIWQSLLEVKT